jgi:hypothetical protein
VAAASVAAVTAPPALAAGLSRLSTRAAVPRAASVVLGGLTGHGWPVVLTLSPNGKRLTLAVTGVDMSCTSGASFSTADALGDVAIGRRGKVHATRGIPAITSPSVSITGGFHTLSGTLNRRRLTFSGSWRLHLDFQMPNGQADHCDSGRVRFTARL